jgi:DNA-directed RNA polymerase specialized sigma subunit
MSEEKNTTDDEEDPDESKEHQEEVSDHTGDASGTSITATEAVVGNNTNSTSGTDRSVETADDILVTTTHKDGQFTTALESRSKPEDVNDRNNPLDQDLDQFTEKQLKVLRAIYEQPNATQAELAEKFGISRATISQRVNRIEEFEWRNRKEFVERVFNGNKTPMDSQKNSGDDVEQVTLINKLTDRMDTLEQRVEEAAGSNRSAFSNSELTAKVIRACVEFDRITEDEEVKIITNLMESRNQRP